MIERAKLTRTRRVDDTDRCETIQRRRRFGGFSARDATAHRAIGSTAIRRFGNAEMNREKRATKLISEVPVAPRKRSTNRIAENESSLRSLGQ